MFFSADTFKVLPFYSFPRATEGPSIRKNVCVTQGEVRLVDIKIKRIKLS